VINGIYRASVKRFVWILKNRIDLSPGIEVFQYRKVFWGQIRRIRQDQTEHKSVQSTNDLSENPRNECNGTQQDNPAENVKGMVKHPVLAGRENGRHYLLGFHESPSLLIHLTGTSLGISQPPEAWAQFSVNQDAVLA